MIVETAQLFAAGFMSALMPENLLWCFVGVLIGTLVGVLPGLGPIATVALLLPATYHLPPLAALIMLAGIYYGASYGGSTTAILVNMPGESSSVVTCIDGHQMARQGRAGPALAIAALASFFAGCLATFVIALFSRPLAEVGLLFGPAEYFSLMVLGLVAAVVLANASLHKAIGMIVLGLFLSCIGADVGTGAPRLTMGIYELNDGIGFIPLAMGLFAVADVIRSLVLPEQRIIIEGKVTNLWPSKDDFRRGVPATMRGSAIGLVLGMLPGGGAMLSSFAAYALEKRLSKHPEMFGKGAVEGVAAPESANNAGAQTSFIPLLTLGIPSNAVIALMAGAMMIQGIQPGPQVMFKNPDLFWGLIASMLIGNAMLVIINLPLIGLWVRVLKVPYRLFYPALLAICCVGVFSVNNSAIDVGLMLVFGLLGYAFWRWGCEPGPLLMAFVLGPLLEESLRRAMLLSGGSPAVFVTSPISLGLLIAAAGMLAVILMPARKRS